MADKAGSDTEPNDDLRGDLMRAMQESASAADQTQADPQETQADDGEQGDAAERQRARDDAGRFAKEKRERETLRLKDKPAPAKGAEIAENAETKADPAKPETKAEEGPAPPAHWKGNPKLNWGRLPPEVRTALKADYDSMSAKSQTYEPIVQVLNGSRDMLMREGGGSLENGVSKLLGLSDWAWREPVQFVQEFIRQRGLNPAQLFGQAQGAYQAQQAQPQPAPEYEALRKQVEALASNQTRAVQTSLLAQIDAFANDPAHIFFNDVSDDMEMQLKANPSLGLQGAYDRAVWANPATRAQLMAQQSAGSSASNPQAVEAARRAKATNLNGSPVPGASAERGNENEDLRATLERAYRDSMGGQRI